MAIFPITEIEVSLSKIRVLDCSSYSSPAFISKIFYIVIIDQVLFIQLASDFLFQQQVKGLNAVIIHHHFSVTYNRLSYHMEGAIIYMV